MVELSHPPTTPLKRRIRSYVRREGRLTPAQRRALTTLWPRYGLAADRPLEMNRIFPARRPVILEIGFGNGESLVHLAENHPQFNYLGIEIHRPGVGRLLLALERAGLTNVRVFCADAVDVLQSVLPERSLHRINIFFPDPWPKKRHHKRRLIQPDFVRILAAALENQGLLHLATDWSDYAEHMQRVLANFPEFSRIDCQGVVPPRPPSKYERRGKRLGHPVIDLVYRKR